METLTWMAVLPPLLVVILAMTTRSIIFSLLMGIVFGLEIYGVAAPPEVLAGRNVLDMTIYGLKLMVGTVGTTKNLLLIFFLVVLGGIIAILTALETGISIVTGAEVESMRYESFARDILNLSVMGTITLPTVIALK